MTNNVSALDLDLVRCFLAVAEGGGFTAASRQLHLTQSAVSLKIRRLEALLGCELFARTSRSVALTPQGEIVLGYARRLLGLSREMVQLVAQSATRGIIRLGVFQQFGPQFLPDLLSQFKRRHPDVSLTVEMGMTAHLLEGLEEDRFDLVLGAAGHRPRSGADTEAFVQGRIVLREPLVWAQSASFPWNPGSGPVPLVAFAPPCGFRKLAVETLEKAGREWHVTYTSASLPSIQAAVQAGLGISVLGASSLVAGIQAIPAVVGLPKLPISAVALYQQKSPEDPLVRELSDFIAEAVTRWSKGNASLAGKKNLPAKHAKNSTSKPLKKTLIDTRSRDHALYFPSRE